MKMGQTRLDRYGQLWIHTPDPTEREAAKLKPWYFPCCPQCGQDEFIWSHTGKVNGSMRTVFYAECCGELWTLIFKKKGE